MSGDDRNVDELRAALDPATEDCLSEAQRDALANAIVAAWSAFLSPVDDGPTESAVYLKVTSARR